ncbi:MAG: helix-turn-helix transcriptional regulator [Acidobacteriota bacterium]|nr:helix-turn-helix transcriptional regulator [Acidobacteriota bacterium]
MEYVRDKVRSGQLTERGLARLTGISQPHMHNALKGIRMLSMEYSDRIVRNLDLSAIDLLTPGEIGLPETFSSLHVSPVPLQWIPLLRDSAGPVNLLPEKDLLDSVYPFPKNLTEFLINPVVISLAKDPLMEPDFREGDLALLDRSESCRTSLSASAPYLVNTETGTPVRFIRSGGTRLYLLTLDSVNEPARWEHLPLSGRNLLSVVKGQIVWTCRNLYPGGNRRPQMN